MKIRNEFHVVDHPSDQFQDRYAGKMTAVATFFNKELHQKQEVRTHAWLYGGNAQTLISEDAAKHYYMQTAFKTKRLAKAAAKAAEVDFKNSLEAMK